MQMTTPGLGPSEQATVVKNDDDEAGLQIASKQVREDPRVNVSEALSPPLRERGVDWYAYLQLHKRYVGCSRGAELECGTFAPHIWCPPARILCF